MRGTSARFPMVNLERAAFPEGITARELGAILGMSRDAVHQHRRRGLTWFTADELATRLDLHAEAVWDDWGAYMDSLPVDCGHHGCERTPGIYGLCKYHRRAQLGIERMAS